MDSTTIERSWPDAQPELIPFIPFVIDAWSDGSLLPAEREILMTAIDGLAWLADGREVLGSWLDPQAPPPPSEIKALRARVRGTSLSDPDAATRSLTDLGLALWRERGEPGPWSDREAEDALRAVEISLGCLGAEAGAGDPRRSVAPGARGRHGAPRGLRRLALARVSGT